MNAKMDPVDLDMLEALRADANAAPFNWDSTWMYLTALNSATPKLLAEVRRLRYLHPHRPAPIRNHADYIQALARVYDLMGAEEGTPQFDEFELLSVLVADYERRHHSMPSPTVEEAVLFRAEQSSPVPPCGGIYIASKTRHADKWRALRASGTTILSTWIDEAGTGETQDFADLWIRCVREAATCDALVFYAECGDVLKGAFVEVGAALAAGRPVYIVTPYPVTDVDTCCTSSPDGDGEDCRFSRDHVGRCSFEDGFTAPMYDTLSLFHHPLVKRVASVQAALDLIAEGKTP